MKNIIHVVIVHEDFEANDNLFYYYFIDISKDAELIHWGKYLELSWLKMAHINQPCSFFLWTFSLHYDWNNHLFTQKINQYLDTIPVEDFKLINDIINQCLTSIINRSHSTGEIPNNLDESSCDANSKRWW